MADRQRIRAALIALLAILVAGAFRAPTVSADGLRAAKCCAEHCAKPRTADAARECCPSVVAASDVDAFAVSAKAGIDAGPTVLAIASVYPSIQSPSDSQVSTAAPPRAAPVFLRTLSLRL